MLKDLLLHQDFPLLDILLFRLVLVIYKLLIDQAVFRQLLINFQFRSSYFNYLSVHLIYSIFFLMDYFKLD